MLEYSKAAIIKSCRQKAPDQARAPAPTGGDCSGGHGRGRRSLSPGRGRRAAAVPPGPRPGVRVAWATEPARIPGRGGTLREECRARGRPVTAACLAGGELSATRQSRRHGGAPVTPLRPRIQVPEQRRPASPASRPLGPSSRRGSASDTGPAVRPAARMLAAPWRAVAWARTGGAESAAEPRRAGPPAGLQSVGGQLRRLPGPHARLFPHSDSAGPADPRGVIPGPAVGGRGRGGPEWLRRAETTGGDCFRGGLHGDGAILSP